MYMLLGRPGRALRSILPPSNILKRLALRPPQLLHLRQHRDPVRYRAPAPLRTLARLPDSRVIGLPRRSLGEGG